MRVCIYKTDEAPDLTMFLREGFAMPNTAETKWTQIRTVTQGEVRDEFLTQMERTGYCVVRLSHASSDERTGLSANIKQTKVGVSHLARIPSFIRRMVHS